MLFYRHEKEGSFYPIYFITQNMFRTYFLLSWLPSPSFKVCSLPISSYLILLKLHCIEIFELCFYSCLLHQNPSILGYLKNSRQEKRVSYTQERVSSLPPFFLQQNTSFFHIYRKRVFVAKISLTSAFLLCFISGQPAFIIFLCTASVPLK